MSTGRPQVGVVVVTWNSSAVIDGLLDSIPAAMHGIADWSLVIVDNHSGDDTVARVSARGPWVNVVQTGRNAGYAAGLNAGVEAIGPCDAYLVLNPDARLQRDCTQRLLAALSLPSVGIAVPRIVGPDGELQHSLRREPSILTAWGEALLGGGRASRIAALGEVVSDADAYESAHDTAWATGAVMAISAACWETTGPWDETFFLYSEETDYALRARDAGFLTRYVPAAVAVHLGGESHTSTTLYARLTVNRVRLFNRRHHGFATAGFWTGVLVNEILRSRGEVHRHAIPAMIRPSRLAKREAHGR